MENGVTNTLYLDKIMEVHHVKERQAKDIKKKYLQKGWIESKQLKHGAIVWLAKSFTEGKECRMQWGDYATEEYHLNNIKYYYYIDLYEEVVDILKDNPTAFCTLRTLQKSHDNEIPKAVAVNEYTTIPMVTYHEAATPLHNQ